LLKHTNKIKIEKISGDERKTFHDTVIEEFPFTIHVNGQALVTLLCSPMHLEYLALGYLESEGFIAGKKSINNIQFDQDNGTVNVDIINGDEIFNQKSLQKPTFTTGCGKGTTFYSAIELLKANPIKSSLTISTAQVFSFINEMQKLAVLFQETGAAHVSILASHDKIIFAHEDIGRHNALDKLFGECIMKDVGYDDKIIVTSGRISSEMLIKCAKRKIPILISRSAATGLSVELAEKTGVTLIGFVREKRMNIYTHGWRVKS
jgi:FdhD protein